MPVCIGTHSPVFRKFVKYCFQIRHIFVDIAFQRNNHALLAVFQQIAVAKSCSKDKISQRALICHSKLNLVSPLVALNCCPADFHIGLFLQALKNRPVIRFRLRICRITDQTGKRSFFFQRKFQIRDICFLHLPALRCLTPAAAASCSRYCHAGCQRHCHHTFHNLMILHSCPLS